MQRDVSDANSSRALGLYSLKFLVKELTGGSRV